MDPFGCHGPGAVFDGSRGKDKWLFDSVPGLPRAMLRSQHGFLPQVGEEVDSSNRVAIVPKDFRAHRIICVERKELMFYQQGLMRVLVHAIHNHELTSSAIDFKNQSRSFRMSRSSKYATIDLRDASDNLSLALARLLIPKEVLKLATIARTQNIHLPDGEEVENYSTLFTMGNGLCFPFQTLIFWALSLATILREENREYLLRKSPDLASFVKKRILRVFGDDIIVPKRHFGAVCSTLSLCGLQVNTAKSCCNTPVREACGSWFYYGVDARIVRLRTHTVSTDNDWVALIQSAKLFDLNGFARTRDAILAYINSYLAVPYGIDWLPGKVPWSLSNVRYNSKLQRVECRVPIIMEDDGPDVLTGEVGLYNYFVGKGSRMAPHHSVQRTEWGWVDRI